MDPMLEYESKESNRLKDKEQKTQQKTIIGRDSDDRKSFQKKNVVKEL